MTDCRRDLKASEAAVRINARRSTEIEALGGYDTSETGQIRQLRP